MFMMLAHVHVHVLQSENRQDTVRIHLLCMTIGRAICAMGILDYPRTFEVGSFGVHIHGFACDGASCTIKETLVTKILRVSMIYLYRRCTRGVTNVSDTYHVILESL